MAHLGGGASGAVKNAQQCIRFVSDLLSAVLFIALLCLSVALFCLPVL